MKKYIDASGEQVRKIISRAEARADKSYFATLYSMHIWQMQNPEAIAEKVGRPVNQVDLDLDRIKITLHALYPAQVEFLGAISECD